MKFRTEIAPLKHQGLITHATPVMMLGSCFTDNVGVMLTQDMFDVMVNPFGTIYNPASISRLMTRIADRHYLSPDEVFTSGSVCHSWLAHSSLSDTDAGKLIDNFNSRIDAAHLFLKRASHIIVTLGTSYIYRLNSTGEVVANCHKMPQQMFTRQRLSVSETEQHLRDIVDAATKVNPQIGFIFTISPIRHLSDGAHGNNLSKSTLMLALESICLGNERCLYFPAYEALIDDLRDYRFYASDLCHPSESAVSYIYELFSASFFNEATLRLALRCRKISKRLNHRQLTPDDEAATLFAEATKKEIENLLTTEPQLKNALSQLL